MCFNLNIELAFTVMTFLEAEPQQKHFPVHPTVPSRLFFHMLRITNWNKLKHITNTAAKISGLPVPNRTDNEA